MPKGKKKLLNKRLVFLILLALGIRFALINLNHPLDLQTWQGMFVDLNNEKSPYDTFERLTYEARATQGAGWSQYYMYYAYPPMLMFIEYPFAKIYGAFYPTEPINYSISGVDPYPQVPLALNFLFKLPIILADIGIALLLYKMTKKSKPMIAYLFNPFVILVSACWMFDSIAVFFLLFATYLFERKRYDLSAIMLSFGFLTKIMPVFALPVFCIELIRKKSWKFLRYAAIFGLVCVIFILPFWSGVKLSFEFQGARAPGGLTPMEFHYVFQGFGGVSEQSLSQLKFVILPAVASFLLIAGMSLIYAYLSKKDISLRQKLLMVFLVYFICAKNLHEPHVLIIIPFLILELHERYSFDKKWQYRLLWILPFIYAIVGVPLTRFLYGYTMDMGILYLFELPVLAKGIIMGTVVVTFHLILWNALITLIRGRPVVSLKGLRQRLKR